MTATEKNSSDLFTNPIVSVRNPEKFNQQLLDGRIDQYKKAKDSLKKSIFFDRGIPDVHAYMHCFGQGYDEEFEQPCYTFRYDEIFLMPPWKDIYSSDNERFETFEESVRIYEYLKETYTNFGYEVCLVPKESIEKRAQYILDFLNLK